MSLARVQELHACGRTLAARDELRALQDGAHEDPLAVEVLKVAADADAARAALDDDSGYTVVLAGERGTLRVLYRQEAGLLHSFKLQGTVPAPLVHVMAVAREFDLVAFWNRFLLDTTVLAAPSPFLCSVYAALWCPYPLTSRDFALEARGVDALDEQDSLLLNFSSCSPPPEALPARAASRVRMRWQGAALRLTAVPGGRTLGTLVATVDPRMPGDLQPPSWAVSWALHFLCPFIFAAARRLLAAIGGPACAYAARIQANPGLYALVAAREAQARARLPAEAVEELAMPDAPASAFSWMMPAA